MTRVTHRMLFFTCLSVMIVQGCASDNMTFQGKVVDAETLKPIEGAVVVAVWEKSRARFIDSITVFGNAKETLTDKNGDWSITGPKGEIRDVNQVVWLASAVLGYYFTHDPGFIIYKPGYDVIGTVSARPGGFSAYPHLVEKRNLEGIVLLLYGNTWDEYNKLRERYPYGFVPFIPMKDPEKKLRAMDFSFQYPENIMKVPDSGIRQFWVYTVTGLREAATKEERRGALPRTPSGSERKTPLLNRMVNEEERLLFGSSSGGETK